MTASSKTMTTASVRVKRTLLQQIRDKATSQGLSINQYLKLIVLADLGQHPPSVGSTQAWLRGK